MTIKASTILLALVLGALALYAFFFVVATLSQLLGLAAIGAVIVFLFLVGKRMYNKFVLGM